eukprot:705901-Rhodomonas_salina.1
MQQCKRPEPRRGMQTAPSARTCIVCVYAAEGSYVMLFALQNALKAVDAVNSLSVRMRQILMQVTDRKSLTRSSGSISYVVGVAHMKLLPPTTNN